MNQRERFEAADLGIMDYRMRGEGYVVFETQTAWSAFKAGEASGMELAFPLYRAVNDLVALFGKHGSIDRRHSEVDAVMDALYQLDCGVRMNTSEQLNAIQSREVEDGK